MILIGFIKVKRFISFLLTKKTTSSVEGTLSYNGSYSALEPIAYFSNVGCKANRKHKQ